MKEDIKRKGGYWGWHDPVSSSLLDVSPALFVDIAVMY
jgi:hypothetical protein